MILIFLLKKFDIPLSSSIKRTVRGYGNIEKYTPTYMYIFMQEKRITPANFARVIFKLFLVIWLTCPIAPTVVFSDGVLVEERIAVFFDLGFFVVVATLRTLVEGFGIGVHWSEGNCENRKQKENN